MMYQLQSKKTGFTLIEMIVYIAVLLFIAVGSVSMLFSLENMLQKYRTEQLVFRNATTVLERMLYDIRNAESVTTATVTHPPILALANAGGSVRYSTSSTAIHVENNGVDLGTLTDEDVRVTSLRFYHYTNTTEFVRIEMTLSATVGESTITKSFNAGAVLRGSYAQ